MNITKTENSAIAVTIMRLILFAALCLLINAARPAAASGGHTLTVNKVLLPASDTGQFVMNANGILGTAGGDGATASATALAGASATFGESAEPGTILTFYNSSYECVDTSDSVVASGTGTGGGFAMPAADVICTITNERKTRITVYKDTVPNAATDFTFTHNVLVNGNLISGGSAILDDDPIDFTRGNNFTYSNVDNGTYTISEEPDDDYDTTISCTGGTTIAEGNFVQVTVAERDVVVCTFTNTLKPDPILTLKKVVINDNGNTAGASSFTLTAAGTNGFSGTGTPNGDDTEATIGQAVTAEETYVLSESDNPEYFVDTDWTCVNDGDGMATIEANGSFNITLPRGADVTCTITNNDKAVSAVRLAGVSAESTTLSASLLLTITLTAMLFIGTIVMSNKRQRHD